MWTSCHEVYHAGCMNNVRSIKIDTPVIKHYKLKGHCASDMTFNVVQWFNKDPTNSYDLRL